MDIHREAFREEARELLAELESALLELEQFPDDMDTVGRVFRAMHTIKGSGAMFGFDDIATFTHGIETVYDLVRNGKITVKKELINLTLSACDQIRKMVESSSDADLCHVCDADHGEMEQLTAAFDVYLGGQDVPHQEKHRECNGGAVRAGSEVSGETTYRVRFRPARDLYKTGTDPALLMNEIHEIGPCCVVAHTEEIPFLDEIDPESCYTYWDVILSSSSGIDTIRDVFIFVEDSSDLAISAIDETEGADGQPGYKKLGEILTERGDLKAEQLEAVLASRMKIGEMLIKAGMVVESKVASALVEQQHIREVHQARQEKEYRASIRVPVERLDGLVNMVGELVTLQSRLTQTAERIIDSELTHIAEEVERLITELRDTTMCIRMLPISTTFSKFQRLVRDLADELGKEITLRTEGGDTELDKTVIDRLSDPLVHLIRNSVDHGIELPALRRQAGKPQIGTIRLSAVHAGANVLIRIEDDGAGLDSEELFRKAVERKLVAADAVLTEKDIYSLILLPGFSTAKTVTNVSGRGVGMDVVKKGIESLHGSIDIVSRKGIGTTITLKLPLTLAIIDGLLVRIGSTHFIIPLASIEEVAELQRGNGHKGHRNLTRIRDEIVPYISLREFFDIEGPRPPIEQIIMTNSDNGRVGFVVDQVVGEYQTVIKSLGRIYRDVEEISGATILGDGKLALILDTPKLLQRAEFRENA